MKIDSNKTLVLLVVFILGSITVKSQNASLKVTNGILYTVDGKWGDGDRLHYSTGKGFNYRASVDIAPGEHVIEYYLMKVKKVYSISFTAKPDTKYLVFNENDKPVVKEEKDILNSAIIENVSAESGKDGYQVIPSIDDTLNVAYLKWDDNDEYFSKYKTQTLN